MCTVLSKRVFYVEAWTVRDVCVDGGGVVCEVGSVGSSVQPEGWGSLDQ